MGEHWRTMAHELPVLVHGLLLLWWLRGVVDQLQCWPGSPGAASESGKTAAWPDPFVLAVVHCLSCCLVLGVSLEANQLLIWTWCLPSLETSI
jgi:hypothetical protein